MAYRATWCRGEAPERIVDGQDRASRCFRGFYGRFELARRATELRRRVTDLVGHEYQPSTLSRVFSNDRSHIARRRRCIEGASLQVVEIDCPQIDSRSRTARTGKSPTGVELEERAH